MESLKQKTKLIKELLYEKLIKNGVQSFKLLIKKIRELPYREFINNGLESIKGLIKKIRELPYRKFINNGLESINGLIKTIRKLPYREFINNGLESFKAFIKPIVEFPYKRFINNGVQLFKRLIKPIIEFPYGNFIKSFAKSFGERIKLIVKSFFEMLKVNKGFRNGAIAVLVIGLMLINPLDASFAKSINKQEFFLYHFKDLLQHSFGEKASAESQCYLATNTYENQLDGDLFGIGKGKNLIIVQMESVQSMVVGASYNGQEITPVLNELIGESGSVYFDNFYCQIGAGNTSDAEFAVNNSLFGSIESYTYQLYENNYFYGLPKIMMEQGYETAVFHGYKKAFWNRENIYPKLGFQHFYCGEDYESDNLSEIGGGNIVGISDEAFFTQTVEKMSLLQQPYYGFTITLSNHNPFGLPKNLKKIKLERQDENIFGNYLNGVHYGDYCLGIFIDSLKKAGLYENSVFLFYGDHYGLTKSDSEISTSVSRWLGEEYTYDEMNRVPLLIHIPGSDVNETISISGGQIDVMPTVSYLMGLEELNTLYLGQNLLTAKVGFAPIQLHMLKGSFIMDDVVFEMSRDGIFKNSKAWNRITKEPLDVAPFYEEYKAAKQAVEVSEFYLHNDILNKVLIEGKSLNFILNANENKNPLPKELNLYAFKNNSDEEIAEMVEYLKSHKKDYLAIDSDQLYTVLKKFEELYAGKKGLTGSILYIDESANEEFLEMRSRIVPLMNESTDNYSKLEYLGYHNIIISPDKAGMAFDELKCFVESNDVDGFLVEEKKSGEYLDLADTANVIVYELRKGLLIKQ